MSDTDKPQMPAHDYAKQWARDTLSGRIEGGQFEWGDRNIARSYLALDRTSSELKDALTIMIADAERCGIGDLADQMDPDIVEAARAALASANPQTTNKGE